MHFWDNALGKRKGEGTFSNEKLSNSLYRRAGDDSQRWRERQRQTKVSPPDLVIFINKSFLFPRVFKFRSCIFLFFLFQ